MFEAWFIRIALAACLFAEAKTSVGDRLDYFRNCFRNCVYLNCSTESKLASFKKAQPPHLQLLGWDCEEECKYECQWTTVNYLLSNGISFRALPQFFGKVTTVVGGKH